MDKKNKHIASEDCAEPTDKFFSVTKLRENLEGAISGIEDIDQRIFRDVRWFSKLS
jgi:hypothetical protein